MNKRGLDHTQSQPEAPLTRIIGPQGSTQRVKARNLPFSPRGEEKGHISYSSIVQGQEVEIEESERGSRNAISEHRKRSSLVEKERVKKVIKNEAYYISKIEGLRKEAISSQIRLDKSINFLAMHKEYLKGLKELNNMTQKNLTESLKLKNRARENFRKNMNELKKQSMQNLQDSAVQNDTIALARRQQKDMLNELIHIQKRVKFHLFFCQLLTY